MSEIRKDDFVPKRQYSDVLKDKSTGFLIYKKTTEEIWTFQSSVGGIEKQILSEIDDEKSPEERDVNIIFHSREKHSPLTIQDVKTLNIISDLEELIEDVKENFDDIRDRQIFFFKFKEKLNELWNISKGDMKKVALRLEYAIKNLKSERLNEKQVDALAKATEVLGKSGGEGKKEIQKILLDAGISTVQKIEGLTELYADEY
ncbi:MAG: hypothetical protein H8D26_06220 [Methanomicrobia archaeon]|nr:hypothetical protein [Methanomicrobia archaeon]